MILEAKSLTKTFFNPNPLTILKGIDLKLRKGESVAIMGKSGAGKSTLLHILGTLDSPSSGSLSICSKPLSSIQISTIRNRYLGFIFQFYYLFEDFSVFENVLMPLKISRRVDKKALKKCSDLIQEVGLEKKKNTRAKFLSGGEKQRVAIARALANDPPLILADEPTGNLDHKNSKEIQSLLIESVKKRGKSMILVTHDEEFARLCDRVLLLSNGKLTSAFAPTR